MKPLRRVSYWSKSLARLRRNCLDQYGWDNWVLFLPNWVRHQVEELEGGAVSSGLR